MSTGLINLGMLLNTQLTSGAFTQPQNLQDSMSGALAQQPNVNFVAWCVEQWRQDPQLAAMQTGQRYYEADNDVHRRKRYVYGDSTEDAPAWMTNNTLSHGFIRKLVRQKIGYFLGRPVTATVADDEALQDAIQDYMDEDFQRTLNAACTNSIVQGISWLQVYYDDDGRMCVKCIPGSEVIPFWADSEHTELTAAIRVYETARWTEGSVIRIEHASFYTRTGVWNYIREDEDGGWHPDEERPLEFSYSITDSTGAEEQYVWNQIPLIPVKYSPEEQPLISLIKDLVDEYDRRTSDIANTLEDEPDRIKIVRNYDGTDRREFVRNLREYRTAFVRDNGDITTLDTSISTDAANAHLDRLRKDIYEFGSGVDTQNTQLGDASGVALRFVYSDLDMDCAIFESEVSWALDQLLWFWEQDMLIRGQGDHTGVKADWQFSTSMIINETERIGNIKNSVGILSDKTLISRHPFVDDPDAELDQIEAEDEAKSRSINELYSFAGGDGSVTITQNQGDDTVQQTMSGTSEAGQILGQASAQAAKDERRQGGLAAARSREA